MGRFSLVRVLRRVWKHRPSWVYGKGHSVDRLLREADSVRDAGRFGPAARLYQTALELVPSRAAIHVQAGHMFKEARDFATAAEHYHQAERLVPEDADLQLQLGHFYKTVDQLDRAETHYARAIALAPGWADAQREHAILLRDRMVLADLASDLTIPAPILVPQPILPVPIDGLEAITFRRLGGRRETTAAGTLPVLTGIEAVRGICFSEHVLVEASVAIDGTVRHRGAVANSLTSDPGITKTAFNLWIDLSDITPGPHWLELVLTDAEGRVRRRSERILVTPASEIDTWPDTDANVTIAVTAGSTQSLEEQIRRQPTFVRKVSRRLMPMPDKILVLRTDQLGDLVISIPAIKRLRELFPAARLVGMLTSANINLACDLGLFDETILVDFPDDIVRRQRTMEPAAQRDLQARLAHYNFDVAIDLATSNMSRSLLRLAGARFTFGFDDGASPWLDGGISGNITDPHTGGNVSPQSGRVLALVERLGTLFNSNVTIIPRTDDDSDALIALGIDLGMRFVVLHAGARVVFSRWPYFVDLASALLARERIAVVLLAEDLNVGVKIPDQLLQDDRFLLIDRRLAFGVLDALLANAAVFVGNDSGPKHLAALRGTPVVSIHCARINWAEWCQEQTGVVMSRRIPCAGCALFHDGEECAKNFACVTDITVAEVLHEVDALLQVSPQG